jgi:hypothetical protein
LHERKGSAFEYLCKRANVASAQHAIAQRERHRLRLGVRPELVQDVLDVARRRAP